MMMTLKNIKVFIKKSLVFKILAFIIALVLILQVFPEKAKFKYEFRKGELWQHDNLYAPFDFPLKKTEQQINSEKQQITNQSTVYYKQDTTAFISAKQKFEQKKNSYFNQLSKDKKELLLHKAETFLTESYHNGIMLNPPAFNPSEIAIIKQNNQIVEVSASRVLYLQQLNNAIKNYFNTTPYNEYLKNYYDIFFDILTPNLVIDQNFTQKALNQNLKEIVYTRGWVNKGKLIIAKGELVEGEKLNTLLSLKEE